MEIVVDPTTGQWFTVGDFGAEFVNIKKGSIVFNHEQTEELLKKGYVLGRASALASGTAMISGGGSFGSNGSTTQKNKKQKAKAKSKPKSKSKSKTKAKATAAATADVAVEVDVRLNDKQLEEKLKDTLSEMSENFDYINSQYEHDIFMKEKNKTDYKEIVAVYKKMLDELHSQAEAYRAKGLSDNSKTVAEVQKSWWDAYEKMNDVIKEHYELEKSYLENSIKLAKNQYDDAQPRNDYYTMQLRTAQIIEYNKQLQELAHETADYYRSIGLEDLSDEIMECSDAWFQAAQDIKEAKENIVDYLVELVEKSSDAVDELQSAFDSFKTAAEEYSQSGGFITIDTFQDLMTMGPQYMQLLRDENGLLVINRENVEKLMAARIRDLAAQAAVSYARRVANAAEEGAVEDLNELLYATKDVTNATWRLAYATLASADLTKDQYEAALFNINSLYSFMENTITGIGRTMGGEYEKQVDGMTKIIEYVMDMLEDRIEKQKDDLNDLVDSYKDIVDLKKESLKTTKEENEYQKSLKGKLKEMAKLQERINALSLDDSREAQAERAKLMEEMADLQDETSELQADKAYDIQTEALDKQYDAYKEEKDAEIKVLEDSISSYQKKWDMAISYMSDHWSTLYDELIEWNSELGSSLNSEITTEWGNAIELVKQYGSVLEAVLATQKSLKEASISFDIDNKNNDAVSRTTYGTDVSRGANDIATMIKNANDWHKVNGDMQKQLANENLDIGNSLKNYGIDARRRKDGTWYIGNTNYELFDMYERYRQTGNETWLTDPAKAVKQMDKIGEMQKNAEKWLTYDRSNPDEKAKQDELDRANLKLGDELTALGLAVERRNGTWYIKKTGEELFKKYPNKYHSGGIVGVRANVKQDEVLAVLQRGEAVLDEQKQNGLYRLIDFTSVLSDKLGVALKNIDYSIFGGINSQSLVPQTAGVTPTINNSPTITFGDTVIYGANDDTVKKHQEISRNMMNELLDTLHIRR